MTTARAHPPTEPSLNGEIPTVVVPALLERGVSEEDLNVMLIENPRRIVERAARHAAGGGGR